MKAEFGRRRERNSRYSLRAFARDMGTDHSTLSQIFRNRRNLSARMISRFGRRLNLGPAAIADACVQMHADIILRLARTPGFCTQSRWIATRTGVPLDAVNVALHRLLHCGELVMKSHNHWETKRPSHA